MRNMGWSVGDSNSIKAWHDPWLSTSQQHHGLLGEYGQLETSWSKVYGGRGANKGNTWGERMADQRKKIVIMSNTQRGKAHDSPESSRPNRCRLERDF